ncbi:hypothetical protein PT7_P046 (plasmid) [Pusillimonas sp. T7-7]|nr:hypothetical protein PT7_P046 [Pusillimonas sp. T7-7]
MRSFVVIAVIVLAGCATAPTWYKDGATQASFDADKAECQYEAIKHAGNYGTSVGQGYAAAMHRDSIIMACLRHKGYSTTAPTYAKQEPFTPVELKEGLLPTQ